MSAQQSTGSPARARDGNRPKPLRRALFNGLVVLATILAAVVSRSSEIVIATAVEQTHTDESLHDPGFPGNPGGADSPDHIDPFVDHEPFATGVERVIVEFDLDTRPESELETDDEIDRQRREIAEAAEGIDRILPDRDAERIGVLETIPVASFEVTPEGLAALEELPGVRSVSIEMPVPPLTLEPSEIVEATALHTRNPALRGAGQVIAILDTGVDRNHPFFRGPNGSRVVSEACYSSTIASQGAVSLCPGGVSASTAPGSGQDCNTAIAGCGHGTHVAGIAAGGETIVRDRPIRGMAPDAGIISIQVFTRFAGTNTILSYPFDQLRALERVKELSTRYDIAAVNMSLGGGVFSGACDGTVSLAYRSLIKELFDAGTPVVVAAGNNGSSQGISTPACVTGAIAVGATTNNGQVASFANTHRTLIDLYAPGQATLSSSISDAGGIRSHGYAVKSGSSTAAPVAAGAFALLRSQTPSRSSADMLAALRSTGQLISTRAGGARVGFAHPEIRLAGAISGITSGPAPTPANSAPVGPAPHMTPRRVIDTRSAGRSDQRVGAADGFGTPVRLDAGTIPGVPTGARALVLNVTATDSLDAGFITVTPCESRPNVSSVNFGAGDTSSNNVIVPIAASGEICFHAHGRTHLIVDVFSYLTAINTITPTRATDTRGGHRIGNHDSVGAPLRLSAASIPGVPADAEALVVNITATDALEAGYVTASACGPVPNVSSVNFGVATTAANSVVVPVGPTGEVCFHAHGRSHLIVDVFSYLDGASAIRTTSPARIIDTRGDHRLGNRNDMGAPLRIMAAGLPGVPVGEVNSLVLNVTATDTLDAGYVTVTPCETLADVSNVNFTAVDTTANTVIVPVGPSGEICVYAHGRTHLIVDAFGYITD